MGFQQINMGPGENPNDAQERAKLRDNAADMLEERVTEALDRAGKIEAFTDAETSADLGTKVAEVVEMDVSKAQSRVLEIENDLTSVGLVANVELPDGGKMNVQFQDTRQLIEFLRQYKLSKPEQTG
ncbi:hypothetical protein COU78_06685 [Candidatus Peregrinibacteria bacterium CG10_big_fil_rev_8_21_14_0_10_49_24]|nr:MAG: hypothetical protein COV83_01980 [Candidatus Peregrinibacteria bacterium CG11_big_fil_rev_8_21_14_0_20_49_14]PIR50377.1 MAG: hypothetical protein COU78_06685 [Candidatus Peregrinibacteria bacterium CG10_big_fil_rev_8_21_14_0_10_49_24]PJA67466.1 MAG: hypothetical protein CO157_03475 [Candidatus Peregrinibacteria bacterium CG_4_9_14_3_um_filter_49_12]